MNVYTCRNMIRDQILPVAGDCAQVEAEQVLMAALDCSRSFLYAHPEQGVSEDTLLRIQAMVGRRVKGEPLQYILGLAPFMGFDFVVRPGVLIPRRDTEILVEHALPFCKGKRVLDLCTGSGCIGISVALLGSPSFVALADISEDALFVARENAKRNGVTPTVYQGDFLKAIPDNVRFDVILSNPPYITSGEMGKLPADVRDYEPNLALEAGDDGLNAYRAILADVSRVLSGNGYLFFEIGYAQGSSVSNLLFEHGFLDVQVIRDYGGNDRVVLGRLP